MVVVPQSLTQILIIFEPNYQFYVDRIGREIYVTQYDPTIPQLYDRIKTSGKILYKAVKDYQTQGIPLGTTFNQNPV